MSSSDSDSILWSMLFGGRLKIVGIYQGLTSSRVECLQKIERKDGLNALV